MAYAAIVTLSKAIHQILPYEQHYRFLCGKEQMLSLREKLTNLQEFLEYISGKPGAPSLAELESRIRDVACQLEDILEPVLVRALDQETESKKPFYQGLLNNCMASRPIVIEDGLDVFVSCIESVDMILKDSMEMKTTLDTEVIPGTTRSLSSRPPGATDTKVGLEDNLNQILDHITGTESALQIIPITGMGGIGKTTLARAVYDHPGLQSHFDLLLWVTVSQEYDIQNILRSLLPTSADPSGQRLIELVHKRLYRRRYLIVFDDMWDEKAWDGVRNALPDDNNSSRIILTTRLLNVASYVCCSTQVHQMKFLSDDECWELLRQKVYARERCPAEFEDIGRAISRICKGLPLVVVVIAGLLKFNKRTEYWEEVARSTKLEAAVNDDSIIKILSLSYRNLPPHQKACFLYFGAYPEDHAIPTKELVKLWSAEGFLKPKESKTIEEVAEECLEELVERNLILVKKKTYNGKVKTSSIHDVLRELSLRASHEENFLHHFPAVFRTDPVTYQISSKDRHRRVSFVSSKYLAPIYTYDAPIRSFLIQHATKDRSGSSSLTVPDIRNFTLLRVLHKMTVRDHSCLRVVCSRMTNLRYLHILSPAEEYRVLVVPKSISKLRNLEVFLVSSSTYYECRLVMTCEIWKMPRLRHLGLKRWQLQFPEPSTNGPILESLQTLSGAMNLDFSRSVIRKIPNLKKLKIVHGEFPWWKRAKLFSLNNLVELHHLEELSISPESCGFIRIPRVSKLAFPENLKKLSLCGTRVPFSKMSIVGSLPNLEVLKLKQGSFHGQVWEPSEGEFLQLKYLMMRSLRYLEEWRAESRHFPSLEKLIIRHCHDMKEVPAEIGEIDTLQQLVLGVFNPDDDNSLTESVKRIAEEQQRCGNHLLQVLIKDMRE